MEVKFCASGGESYGDEEHFAPDAGCNGIVRSRANGRRQLTRSIPTVSNTVGKNSFDPGVGSLLTDLASTGLLKDTLVVIADEFGCTVGPLSAQGGRDHYLQQFVAFAGGGMKGGRVIGATTPDGSPTADFGWKYNRYVRPEDVECTTLSALGIDWTKQMDTQFGRPFEYVPSAAAGLYAPIDELWA